MSAIPSYSDSKRIVIYEWGHTTLAVVYRSTRERDALVARMGRATRPIGVMIMDVPLSEARALLGGAHHALFDGWCSNLDHPKNGAMLAIGLAAKKKGV